MVPLRESDGQVFLHGDALIELARALGGAWRVFNGWRTIATGSWDGRITARSPIRNC